MASNPYASCPCGSGKKLKFCCAEVLDDLERFRRLVEHQPSAAESLIRSLVQRFPEKENLLLELVELLDHAGRRAESRELLTGFLKNHPDNPRVLVRLATQCVLDEGFESSRRILHRALQIASKVCPTELARIVGMLGMWFSRRNQFMAAREHLALGVRLASVDQSLAMALLQALASIEGDSGIPMPLRSSHGLLPISGSEELKQQDLRARKLSLIGCWEPAAILYTRMSEADPANGAIWFNLGLCRAWDARITEATEAFHKAASLLQEWESVVEAESLAVLLEMEKPERHYRIEAIRLNVLNPSELVNQLATNKLVKQFDVDEDDDEENREAAEGIIKTGGFELFDRPLVDEVESFEQLPRSVVEIEMFDVTDDSSDENGSVAGPHIVLSGPSQHFDEAIQFLNSLGTGLVDTAPENRVVVQSMTAFRDSLIFDFGLYRPDGMSVSRHRRLVKDALAQATEKWLTTPAASLGGKTPLEASGIAELKGRLAGLVYAVHSANASKEDVFDPAALCQRLGLPAFTTLKLAEGQNVLPLPLFQLMRLDPADLNDRQLREFVGRSGALGLVPQTRAGLEVLTTRPEAMEEYGVYRTYMMLSTIARSEDDLSKLTECCEKVREWCATQQDSFRKLLELNIRELAMRLDDPTDPQIVAVLHRLRDKFIPKLPEVYELIIEQLVTSNCEHLIPEVTPQAVMSSAGGLWTPGSAQAAPAAGGSSLWLPGQS
ncbi:MAG: SEC-C domain-containing protein [Planctomyces sp.]|nr:SEC-C domain-containing protein [Planctomyces sp.]